jgi:hypothetical protein
LIDAAPTRSTSEKTTPKPVTPAGVSLPGTTKVTSEFSLPIGANVFGALKLLNWAA